MAILATAVKKANINDAVQGGWISLHTVSLDPASIAAAAQGGSDITVAGVKSGDMVFCAAEGPLAAELSMAGAKVTATDQVTIYLNNNIDATTAINDTAKVYNLLVVHLT